jgi:hypothetical protein
MQAEPVVSWGNRSRRERRAVICGAFGALAACWLAAAVLLATGAVLGSGLCGRGDNACGHPPGIAPLIGQVLGPLGWLLVLIGPVVAVAVYRKLRRSWVGRRMIARLIPWPIAPRR